MRFKCWPQAAPDITKWHRWFAWHPVKVEDGYCCWLETVERKGSLPEIVMQFGLFTVNYNWQYRTLP